MAERSFGQDGEMRQHAGLVRIESVTVGRPRAAEMIPDSLLNFTDPAGTTQSGSLWAWGAPGRPLAILELSKEKAGSNAVRWVEGVTSFSPDLITATWGDGHQWQSSAPGLTMSPVADIAAPAESESARLRQMKTITRKFVLREDAGPVKGMKQLRLLPNPIHRYSDKTSGLRDGAIFVFAYGTNPEAFLAVEARSTGDSLPVWHYGVARVTGGALAAELDGQEVWKVGEADPPHTGPSYMNRFRSLLSSK
ncbi:MAG: hypothetical protein P4L85_12365 [Paludisphaera borealis]|uniref:hypothetical protein n=1 Tax=Paludisphaera borealis TaxID=1387353 RepID=UPI0028433B4F|nr:hypothetical protein [Paludisphaera borealis]MDR3620138.1 hypothetical protein [Paludisphaera borealis]